MSIVEPEAVLQFWFGDGPHTPEAIGRLSARWFSADAEFDAQIAERFGELPERAISGGLDGWRDSARSSLALVIVLDQFPRNLHRGTPRCFEFDAAALEAASQAIESGFDRSLAPYEAPFMYLPFEHAEDPAMQARCVALHAELLERVPADRREGVSHSLDYAVRHQRVIERFGRFPHRNEQLGRTSTAEEIEYLASGGDHF